MSQKLNAGYCGSHPLWLALVKKRKRCDGGYSVHKISHGEFALGEPCAALYSAPIHFFTGLFTPFHWPFTWPLPSHPSPLFCRQINYNSARSATAIARCKFLSRVTNAGYAALVVSVHRIVERVMGAKTLSKSAMFAPLPAKRVTAWLLSPMETTPGGKSFATPWAKGSLSFELNTRTVAASLLAIRVRKGSPNTMPHQFRLVEKKLGDGANAECRAFLDKA